MTRKVAKDEKEQQKKDKELKERERVKEFWDEVPDGADERENNDEDFINEKIDRMLKVSDQNMSRFTTVASVSLRYGASDRVSAAIATATMIDLGIVTADKKSLVLDQSKIAREKKRLMEKHQQKADMR